MEIFPNWTTIPIIVFLISLVFILNRTFFRPLGKTLEERHHLIQGADKEAAEIRKASQERLAEFDRRLRDVRREMGLQMAQAKQAALGEKGEIITARKSEVEAMVASARKEIRQKKEEARESLEAQARSFAYQIASRVLGRNVEQKES